MQKGQTSDFHLLTSDAPTHSARIGAHDWPAWVHDDTHMIVCLRVGRKDEETAFDEQILREAGVPADMIASAKTSMPIRGYILVEKDTCSEYQADLPRSARKSKQKPKPN